VAEVKKQNRRRIAWAAQRLVEHALVGSAYERGNTAAERRRPSCDRDHLTKGRITRSAIFSVLRILYLSSLSGAQSVSSLRGDLDVLLVYGWFVFF